MKSFFPNNWRSKKEIIKLENEWSECTCSSVNTNDVVESKAVGT